MITQIRRTREADLPEVMEIYAAARVWMRQCGNPSQWGDHYPSAAFLREEIAAGHSFLCVNDQGAIAGTFCLILGEDPTYREIFDGAWLNEEPYGTLHRIASSGREKGVVRACVEWCFTRCPNLRVDTHRDNRVMQRILESMGFSYCGIIYVADGSERLAYQKRLPGRTTLMQTTALP
ncbi:MAG: GNAT family N-acetyltransferase [Proteiniphilum sp.]|nr:GNAT family N-acetyltransferase [Proteiniphilum sp.]